MRKLLLAVASVLVLAAPAGAQKSTAPSGLGWRNTGFAPGNATFLVQTSSPELSEERVLVSSNPFFLFTDGGANGNFTLSVGSDLAIADGGTGASTAAAALINLIGAPTKGKMVVGDGAAWNVLSVGSNGSVLTADSGQTLGMAWSAASLGPSDLQYVVLALDSALSNERRIVGTANKITLTDGGANGDLTLNVGTDIVQLTSTQTLTNKTLTNPVINDQFSVEKGSNDVTVTFAAPASSTRTINFPDPGANADVVYTVSAQTVGGVKTFSSAPVLGTGTVTVSGQTITFPAATDTVALLAATQSLSNKTLVSAIAETSLVLKQTTANYTVTWANPAGARAYRVTDVGGSADFLMKDQGDSYTAGGVPYADGSLMQITGGGSEGQVFTMGASNIPAWATPDRPFGGTGDDGTLVSGNMGSGRTFNATNVNITSGGGGVFIYEYLTVLNATGSVIIDGGITVNSVTDTGGDCVSHDSGDARGGPGGGYGGGNGAMSWARGGGAGGASCVGDGGRSGHNGNNEEFVVGPKATASLLQGRSGGGGGGSSASSSDTSGKGTGGLPSVVVCAVGPIDIQDDAFIQAHGGDGEDGTNTCGGGGGSAGPTCAMLSQDSIVVDAGAVVEIEGGAGGNGGTSGNTAGAGGGAGGLFLLYAPDVTDNSTPTYDGGAGGTGNGSGTAGADGDDGTTLVLEGTPSNPIISYMSKPENMQKVLAGELRGHRDICRATAGGNMVAYFELLGQTETCFVGDFGDFVGDVLEMDNAA